MPRARKKTPALRGSRPTQGPRGGHCGGGRLPGERSLFFSESAQPFRHIGEASLQPAKWAGSSNVTDQRDGFTLAQEARQTSQQDHSIWNPNCKLRSNPVAFLSVGTSEPPRPRAACNDVPSDNPPGHRCSPMTMMETGDTSDLEESNLGESDIEENVLGPKDPDVAAQSIAQENQAPRAREAAPFFIDLLGQNSGERAHKAYVGIPSRVSSPESSSSGEVILFRGRNRGTQNRGTAQVSMPKSSIDDSILDDYIANMLENGEIEEQTSQKPHQRRAQDGMNTCQSVQSNGVKGSTTTRGQDAGREKSDGSVGDKATENIDTQSLDGAHSGNSGAESELDDETLAKLFAGQSLDPRLGTGRNDQHESDSDSTDDVRGHGRGPTPQWDEFDFMNWERPSLQRKKSRRSRAPIPFDGCASTLEQQLQAAWQKDRLRKKQRKKQREESRVLGMLGHGTKPDDLRVKYPTGMSTTEVTQELRSFLVCMRETLTFPPMDLHARKMIHELANQFKVNSKSAGKADQRRTTLFRTKRTMPYIESTFENAMSRIRRRQLPRPDAKRRRAPIKRVAAGGSHTAASYRDGEIIGGTAAELGIENRGRAMLEKMGWSSGTALGAAHNKGILQPVTHTMKRSKAGLG
ncbi:r3H domain-containing protein [Hirsutella rhossiliensis]